MASILDTKQRIKSFVLSEADGMRSRSTVTVAQTGAAIASGTLMGRITASGKWKAYSNAASDGSEQARGILYNHLNAATGDVKAVVFDQDCEVNRFELTGLDAAGEADLLALGIKVRGAAGALEIATPAL